jgi:site-specific recombinase XerD
MRKEKRGELAALLESFFRQRLADQLRASPATVAAYRDTLRMLLLFISARLGRPPAALSLDDLSRDNILAFLDDLEKTRGNSIRTRNVRLASIRSFFTYVSFRDPAHVRLAQQILSIEGKRCVKRIVGYLRQEELAAILEAPDRASPLGRRDYALLLFLARTGARVSEAISVNAADLRLERPTQVKLLGKGSKGALFRFPRTWRMCYASTAVNEDWTTARQNLCSSTPARRG